jgi:8-oxo-dGTP pyrophosphatase MutT (NUDIX family)
LVFPGGVCEDIDDKYLKSGKFEVFSRITAIRETVEETGVLILPPKVRFERVKEFKEYYRKKEESKISELIAESWS